MKLTNIKATAPIVKFATSGNWVKRKGTPKQTNALIPFIKPFLNEYVIIFPTPLFIQGLAFIY